MVLHLIANIGLSQPISVPSHIRAQDIDCRCCNN